MPADTATALQQRTAGVAAEADLYDQLAPSILQKLEAKSSAAGPRHTSLRVQARALYRKSAVYQKSNVATNICIVSAPVFFCILLLLMQVGIQKLMSGDEYTCGCQCTKCCYGGRKDNCTSLANSTCPYTCLERNNSNCGLQFSVGTQVAFCDMQHPSAWPAVIQTPKKEERAAINRPKVTLLYASGQNDTLSQNLAEKLLPQPVLQASTLLAAQQYLAQFAQEMPSTSIPGEAFALLGMKRLGSSSVMMKAAGLYLEAALAPNTKSLDLLWHDGTCKQLGMHDAVNTSIITALQAIVNVSNSAGIAALLNSRISSLKDEAGGTEAAKQVAGVQVNCTDVVLTKVPAAKLQRVLYCGNRLAACNGKKVTNSFAGAYDWADTSAESFTPVMYYNDTFEMPDDGSDIGSKYTRKPQLLNMAVNSWLSNILGPSVSAELLGVAALPLKAVPFSVDWTLVIGPVLATWILQLLLPVFVGQLVEEKEHKLRMMMKMHGMQDGAYWLVQYSWFLVLYIVYAAAFLIFGTATRLGLFTFNDYGIQICLLFVWGNAMVAMSLLLSCFFTSTRTATVFCYMLVFATGLFGYMLMRPLLDLQGFAFWIEALEVVPPLALYRGMYELGSYASLGMQRQGLGMSPSTLYDGSNGMVHVCAMLAGEWVVMMLLAWYLEQVYASGTGNRRPPLYFLDYLKRNSQQQQQQGVKQPPEAGSSSAQGTVSKADAPVPISTLARTGSGFAAVFAQAAPVKVVPVRLRVMRALGAAVGTTGFPLKVQQALTADATAAPAEAGGVAVELGPLQEPPDVMEERLRVAGLGGDDLDNPLVIRGLRKVYPGQDGQPPKLAVQRLDLAVAAGECFGLLGPNGAGKSTSISMLVGLQEPSAGTAIIGGHDITQGMQPVYNIMGLCPQHDLLWTTLSGREHLRFYGTLKGLSGPELDAAIQLGLTAIKLWSVADKPCGSYSGGMRRRLSVAISLVGNPRVVYLDEPSTGLDPASRRVLWEVIKASKPGRAIILTTHNMEEADFLCDRLGIFVGGRMACIGHPKDITSRFCGYLLFTISVPADREGEARQLVTELAPGAQLTYSVGGTLKYELPTEQVSLSRVFSAMAGLRAAELGVIDWAVANATMEEVFIRITQQMNIKAAE